MRRKKEGDAGGEVGERGDRVGEGQRAQNERRRKGWLRSGGGKGMDWDRNWGKGDEMLF